MIQAKIKKIRSIFTIVAVASFGVYMVVYYPDLFFSEKNNDNQEFLRENGEMEDNEINLFSLVSTDENIKGMSIEKYHVENELSILETTGAIFNLNFEEGSIEIYQKIGKSRKVAKIYIEDIWFKELNEPIVGGYDYVWQDRNDKTPRVIISGDSVIRLFNIKKLKAKLEFVPIHAQLSNSKWEFTNNGLLALDDWGGIALMPPSYANNEKWPKGFNDNTWELSGNESLPLLFIGILPPRKFDWDRSFMPIIHYSSHIQRYPTDEQIADYSKYAKILEMHSWVWQDRHNWNDKDENGNQLPSWMDYSYLPQNGKWIPDDENELKRVIAAVHKYHMKFVPYVSLQLKTGNLDAQLEEVKRLKEEYGIDGIYIDGIFLEEYPETSYIAARKIRQIFGEDGWLTLHNTHASGYWAPFINSYMDFIVTSEHDSFNQWTSTSYNISNSIASVWPEIPLNMEDGRDFLKKIVDDSLRSNNRVLLMTGENGQWREWRLYFNSREMEFMKEYYLGFVSGIADNINRDN